MRIGVLSDIHANRPALDAVLSALQAVGVDRILCCGDIVGCGLWPAETVDRLRQEKIVSVRGNHDDAVLHLSRYRSPGHEEDLRMLSWTAEQLTADQHTYLASLPERREEDPFTLAHGSLRPSCELVEFVLGAEEAEESFAVLGTWIGLVGHAHVQALYEARGDGCTRSLPLDEGSISLDPRAQYLINPGSVGMPRDAEPSAAFAWLDLDEKTLTFTRATYDPAPAAEAIQGLGSDGLCRSAPLEHA